MPDSSSSAGATSLSGSLRVNDLLSATQNAVVAVNNLSNTVTTKFSSIQQPTLPGGSSGQVQFNNSGAFGGFTLGGDATLVASAGTLTVGAGAITYAKIQNESSGTLLGNTGVGSAAPSEQKSSQVTSFLTPFSSVVQGVVNPSSNSNTSGFYLGGDNAFHATTASGLVFLGSVTTVSSQIVDTSTTTNILAANNSAYRSFKLILKNVVPNTGAVSMGLQVHSTGGFQTTSYVSGVGGFSNAQSNETTNTSEIIFDVFALANAAPGMSADITVSNLAGTAAPKMWFGHNSAFLTGAGNITIHIFGGFWNVSSVAIDGFQLVTSAGAITSGSVDVYGML